MVGGAAEIFEECIGVPEAAWPAVLDRRCGTDPALRAQVEGLLRAHESAGSFLGMPTRAGVVVSEPFVAEKPGSSVGRYRLLELIGEGGFGRVFMAEQREPVVRRVAVKVIKAGMDSAQVVARFEAERQALAMMDHPGIATVLDGGVTETGRPYFVMELVRGTSITAYCDGVNMPVPERLELFRQVCGAVQHAHQKGIIHRDLKPGNILVAERGDRPQPKVIDFGIAKAISGRLTDRTMFTEFRQFVGTPAYVSPEQTRGGGQDVDTRADIYSLGVLLYELLTGTTPLEPGSLHAADLAEIQRLIREGDTPRPSTRVSTLKDASGVAAHRRTEPRRLGLLLRGDLDWIVLKAVEKDRNRRYETASALAEDVRRSLAYEPVSASPPGAVYRVRKFIRRNRGAVIAGSLVCGALALGIVGTSVGLVSSMAQRARAERALARANEVKDFVGSMLRAVSPELAAGHDTALLRMILDDAASRVESGDIDDPLIAAELRDIIGEGYRTIGVHDRAETLLSGALEARTRQLGPDAPDTIGTAVHLGTLRSWSGRYAEAEEMLRDAGERATRVLGPTHVETWNARNNLAALLQMQNRLPEAEGIFRELADVFGRVPVVPGGPADTTNVAQARANLGYVIAAQGKPGGEAMLREALRAYGEIQGEDHANTIRMTEMLAGVVMQQGRLDETSALLASTLERIGRVLGADHPMYINNVNNQFAVLCRLGRAAEAAPYLEGALETNVRARGEDDPLSLVMRRNVGMLLDALGREDEAEPILTRAVEGLRRVRGDDHPHTLSTVSALASVLRERGRLAEAESLAREALEGFTAASGPGHYRTIGAATVLGAVLRDQGRFEESERALLGAWEKAESAPAITAWERAACAKTIAGLYEAWNAAAPAADRGDAARVWRERLAGLPAESP